MKESLCILCLALLLSVSSAKAQTAPNTIGTGNPVELRKQYHVAQVDEFDLQPGVQFPAEYLTALQ